VSYPGERFRGLGRLEPRLRVGARPACAVELGLGLSQRAGLPPALGAGVDPVPLVEALNCSCQRLVFFELAAIFLQLAQSLGDVPKQFRCERRQGLGECVRERGFVGLFRQLRLTQLNQRIHQGVVTPGAEMEQSLIDRAPVADGSIEHLAAAVQRVAQAFPGQDHALIAHQPDILIDARSANGILQHEEPAVHLGTRSDRGKPGAECEVMRRSVVGEAAEFDPGVADPPVIAAHQQIPRHLLAAIAVRFDARGLELCIEQEGQRQRQHLGFAGAVVAPQQQMPVAEPELLAVVVKQLH
jgi:hypothetical protein